MLRIGLTGGIGAGKSTVAGVLRAQGGIVVDADQLAREVVAPGTPGLAAVVAEFGPGVLRPDGSLDRAALGRLVFAADDRRQALEAITHPLVARRTAELVQAAPADAVVVHDVPLIVEKAMGALYHLVLVVDAPPEARVARLVRSRGMSPDDARARIAAQADEAARRAAADVWLDTDRPEADVARDVERLWVERLAPFEHNVRTGARVKRPDIPTLVPYDRTWPAQAARLAARVDRAVGGLGRGTEHIGSTSVPGLMAKDVIDLQLAVASLAHAEPAVAELTQAGFPLVSGLDHDHVHPAIDPDPAHWVKRFHGGADPGRVVHLHVREVGSPGWRTALLLRDWWRTDPDARQDYEREKRRLAAAAATTSDYAEAKEPYFAQVAPRALAWAAGVGWRAPDVG